jgi:hypothetical protein
MLNRVLFGKPMLVLAGVALALSFAPRAQADPPRCVHLQISLYELREAKEDVRGLKGVPDEVRNKMLGGIDNAIAQLKAAIEAAGVKVEYIKPESRPEYPNFQHLRHAIKEMKEAKEQVRIEKEIPPDVQEKTVREISRTVDLLEKALDYVK